MRELIKDFLCATLFVAVAFGQVLYTFWKG